MTFPRSFSRLKMRWRLTLFVAGIMAGLAFGLIAFIALGVFDYVAPFSDQARPVVAGALGSVCAGILILALLPIFQMGSHDVAASLDKHSWPRRPVTTAFELSARPPGDTSPMRDFLVQRSLAEGERAVAQLSFPEKPAVAQPLQARPAACLASCLLSAFCALQTGERCARSRCGCSIRSETFRRGHP